MKEMMHCRLPLILLLSLILLSQHVCPAVAEPVAEQGNGIGIASIREFGATGDGTSDDTEAIQKAISAGDTVYFPAGTYRISRPIEITGKRNWSLYAQDATFIYTGGDYAFRINALENSTIAIGDIKADSGGGILFYAKSSEKWNQYVKLFFNSIECATDCILIEVSGGWSNENQVYGGRFARGKNGVRISYPGGDVLNGWKFYNCGIEGVNTGFVFDAGRGYITGISVVNSRYSESFETVLRTVGKVQDCLWISPCVIEPAMISCSRGTNRFEIYSPIGENGHRGCIINGKLMVEDIHYKEAE